MRGNILKRGKFTESCAVGSLCNVNKMNVHEA